MIEAVLWDLDGVLVDTARFHYQAWRQLFDELGRSFGEEEFRRTFGLRNDLIFRQELPDTSAEEMERLSDRKEALFRRFAAASVTPLPGALDLVRRTREKGRRMALVTSTPRANIDFVLGQIGLAEAFETIVAAEDVSRGKPDPEGYLLAARRLGVRPERCLVIEDAPGGIEAGMRAGMHTLGVATTHAREELTAADAIIERLDDPAATALLEDQARG